MKKGLILFITSTFVLLSFNVLSQESFKLVPESSSMKISGTSTLHDWEMKVENFKCDISAEIANPSITIDRANFTGISTSVVSHNSIMDNKAQDALKADKYPEIKFKLMNQVKLPSKGNTFNGTATGELLIAGKSRTINLPFTGKLLADNSIEIIGSKQIDMTEFGIQPPTAMFGTLKTGNDVTISFTINLKQQQAYSSNIQ